jgi:hypothetical protein
VKNCDRSLSEFKSTKKVNRRQMMVQMVMGLQVVHEPRKATTSNISSKGDLAYGYEVAT